MPGRWWANQTFKLWCRRAGHWKTKETAEVDNSYFYGWWVF